MFTIYFIDPKSLRILRGNNQPEEIWFFESAELTLEWLNEITSAIEASLPL